MGTHPIFESDFDCLTDLESVFLKIKMAPAVPEALKKKRQAHQAALAEKALAKQNAKKANILKRRAIIKRSAAYAKEYANKERVLITKATGKSCWQFLRRWRTKTRSRRQNQRYQPGIAPCQEDFATSPTSTNWKCNICQAE